VDLLDRTSAAGVISGGYLAENADDDPDLRDSFLGLPDEVLEAGMIDGASPWQSLWRIKIPLMKPVMVVAILFQTIDAARLFDIIFILTRGGPGTATETLSLLTYLNGFGFLKMGYAAASGLVLTLIIAVLALLIIRFGKVQLD